MNEQILMDALAELQVTQRDYCISDLPLTREHVGKAIIQLEIALQMMRREVAA